MEKCWIGADPGGKGRFGVAALMPDQTVRTWCVSCAEEAVEHAVAVAGHDLAGVGVDSPLWWSAGLSGDRKADQWLRKTYNLSGGTVQASNSLRGAALIQGALFVEHMRIHNDGVQVTETHPKALLKAMGIESGSDFFARFSIKAEYRTEHERDAIISAVAAREGFEGRWVRDLSLDRLAGEQDPRQYWLAPVHYFWPD